MIAGLTDDELMVVKAAGDIAAHEVVPHIGEIEQHSKFPVAMIDALREHGLLSVGVAAERGGAGVGRRATLAVIERLAAVSAAVADLVASVHTVEAALVAADDLGETPPELCSQGVLVDLSEGTAMRSDDEWVVSGTAARVHHAVLADCFMIVVDDGAGLVAATPGLGIEIGPIAERTGLRGVDARRIAVRDVKVGPRGWIGGSATVQAARGFQRLAAGRIAVGIARRGLEEATGYVRTRRQFGITLSELPAIRDMVARMSGRIDAADGHLEMAFSIGTSVTAASAAADAVGMAVDVTLDALQLHGGYGYTTELPIERLVRDAVSLRASLGGTRRLRTEVGSAELS